MAQPVGLGLQSAQAAVGVVALRTAILGGTAELALKITLGAAQAGEAEHLLAEDDAGTGEWAVIVALLMSHGGLAGGRDDA